MVGEKEVGEAGKAAKDVRGYCGQGRGGLMFTFVDFSNMPLI